MSGKRQVGFLSLVPDRPSAVPDFAKGSGRITRKKLTDAYYTSESKNTFRVLGEQAEFEKANEWGNYRKISRPPPPEKINEPLSQVPYPIKEASVHHIPHSKTAQFIRTNVRFINRPIWCIEPKCENDSAPANHKCDDLFGGRRDFYSASYIGQPGTRVPEPIVTTYKGDYPTPVSNTRNTRHGSNFELLRPAHGIIPVNELREKDGKQRVWSEKMSYKQIYDSRADPNYPWGLKKQGAFVSNRIPDNVLEAAKAQAQQTAAMHEGPSQHTASTVRRIPGAPEILPTSNWQSNQTSSTAKVKKVEFGESCPATEKSST